MGRFVSVFRYYGGKYYLAKWLISHFPPMYRFYTYVEPFFGAGNVLLKKDKSVVEIANDINPIIYLVHHVVKNYPNELQARLRQVDYSESTFNEAMVKEKTRCFTSDIDIVANEIILRRMSFLGFKTSFSRSLNHSRGGVPQTVSAWNNSINVIPLVSERLKSVTLLNKDALEVIRMYDSPVTFFYLDPPYLISARRGKSLVTYEYDYTESDHIALATLLKTIQGKFMISGYDSELYNDLFSYCTKFTKMVHNYCAIGKNGKEKVKNLAEVIWVNY